VAHIVLRFLPVLPTITGEELRSRRLRLGVSRDQLAHSLGVLPAMVVAWEADEAEIACPNALRQILQQSEERWPTSDSMS
jgi:DNA-binding transcriptional regulator YiaG